MQFLIFLFLAARIKQELITATTSTHGCAHTHSEWNKDCTSVFFFFFFSLCLVFSLVYFHSQGFERAHTNTRRVRKSKERQKNMSFFEEENEKRRFKNFHFKVDVPHPFLLIEFVKSNLHSMSTWNGFGFGVFLLVEQQQNQHCLWHFPLCTPKNPNAQL